MATNNTDSGNSGNSGHGGGRAQWRRAGELLEHYRLLAGMSKREAADRAGVSESAWRMYEGGGRLERGQWVTPRPQDETLYRVAYAVGMSPRELFAVVERDLPPEPRRRGDEAGALELVGRVRQRLVEGREAVDELERELLAAERPGE